LQIGFHQVFQLNVYILNRHLCKCQV